MKKVILSGIILVFLSGAAMGSEVKVPEQKAAVTEQTKKTLHWEKDPANASVHKDNMDFLKAKFSAVSKLIDKEKEGLIICLESQYPKPVFLREQRYNGKVVYFEQIVNNPKLTLEQKKNAIKSRFAKTSQSNMGL